MITNICLLLEAFSIVICLHHLYGEKFRLDIVTTSFLAVDMIIMTIINNYSLPKIYTMVIYPVIAIYCGIRFGLSLKPIIINNILYLVIMGGIQLIVLLVFGHAFGDIQMFANTELLLVNCITFIIVLFILPKCKVDKLSNYLQDKDRILIVALIISVLVMLLWLLDYKRFNIVELNQSVLLFITVVLICILTAKLVQSKLKSKEIETELKMHQIYADSFRSLIDNIRLRQHEFDNHIHTIYSQHYMFDTYEELVNAQKDYCQVVTKENRYNKLLKAGNPFIIGFLYGKFIEIEKSGIEISYKINIEELNVGVPIYELVEILGDLIKNAVEALETSEANKKLFVSIIEIDGEFEIEVRNTSRLVDYDEIGMFFRKGFSQKGIDRGLGLYNVKNICNEYILNIFCENKTIDNENWLSFLIKNKKETT